MSHIRFFTYSMYHNKEPVVGSTYIRVNQLLKYWPEADLYRYGENPDALIFQKVYCSYDYKFPKHFEGIKILDICDPDWLDGMAVAETARGMDAITVPTEGLAKFMRQLTDAPVYVVPDRWDLETFPSPRKHIGEAKTVVWFGYSHNADTLRPAINTINRLGLNLIVISNDDPLIHRYGERDYKEYYRFRKFDQSLLHYQLQEADFAILPGDYRPQGRFKSNNKTTRAILCGLPVATNLEEVELYMNANERTKYMDEHYDITKNEYDVRKSVEQMKAIIEELQNANANSKTQ